MICRIHKTDFLAVKVRFSVGGRQVDRYRQIEQGWRWIGGLGQTEQKRYIGRGRDKDRQYKREDIWTKIDKKRD